MSKFILVHDARCNASPVIINVKTIAYVNRSAQLTGASHIQLNDLDNDTPITSFDATESPEQLFEMLK